jgi:NAD-dependent deacetylase
LNTPIEHVVQDLLQASHIIALTGAGISVESGIPPFRGPGGVWEKFDPMEFAHIDAFRRNPAKVWQALFKDLKRVIDQSRPNAAHRGLAQLEQWGKLQTVITQNIDGLHQLAGNTDVIEFHGTMAWQRCMQCDKRIQTQHLDLSHIPPRCECGGVYRPDCVLFGEMIPQDALERSQEAAQQCDLMLVVGTSAIVEPAASIPYIAKEAGAKIIEINPEATALTGSISSGILKGKAGDIFQVLLAKVQDNL